MTMLNEGTMILAVENYTMEDLAACPICGEEHPVPTMKLTEEDSEPICETCFYKIEMEAETAPIGYEPDMDPMIEVESYAIEYDEALMDDADDFHEAMDAEF